MKHLTRVWLMGLLAALAGSAAAETYVCQGGGRKVYQDVPCAATQKTLRTVEDGPAAPVAAPAKPADSTPGASAEGSAKDQVAPPAPRPFKKNANAPTISLYYNPGLEPPGITMSQVESVLQGAAAAWSQGCNVNLVYRGIKNDSAKRQSAESGYIVRWDQGLQHVSNNGLGAAGQGGPDIGIILNPEGIRGADDARRVVVHELGHVLGIDHIHDDPLSVMSYLSNRKTQMAAKPNATDYLNCNMVMSRRFNIPFDMPAGARPSAMSDEEAARRLKASGRG